MTSRTIVFAVTVHGYDFDDSNEPLAEAATWLESHLARSIYRADVTAYDNAQDAAQDECEQAGHWEVRK
jgi:hypothetical protein